MIITFFTGNEVLNIFSFNSFFKEKKATFCVITVKNRLGDDHFWGVKGRQTTKISVTFLWEKKF